MAFEEVEVLSKVIVRRMVVTRVYPEGEIKVLVVQIDIDCGVCEPLQVVLNGHHLKALHTEFGKIIEALPELCGEPGEGQETLRFSGVVDPKKVGMN